MLELTLLGSPSVNVRGHLVKLPTRKAFLLLAYVAVEGETSRARLADLLWPDVEGRTARQNLRAELYRLSRTPVGEHLAVTDAFVAPSGPWRADVTERDDVDPEAFLAGGVPEGPFAEWRDATRARWSRDKRARLERRLRTSEASGDLSGARDAAAALVRLDELDEAAWRDLVRLCVLERDERGARAAFEAYAEVRRREFGAPPDEVARRWLDALHVRADKSGEALHAPLVGRDDAWRTLQGAGAPWLLLGEPGVGKSRLVHEFAAAHRPRLVVRGLPEARAWPLGALKVALRSARDRGLFERATPDALALLARLVPGDQGDAAFVVDGSPEHKVRLFEHLARVLVSALGRGTLVLEDVHDFDDLGLEALRTVLAEVARAPRAARPRILLTARAPELHANDAARILVDELERRGALRTLHVRGLRPTEVLEVVRATTGTTLGARFAERLYDATGGNPLFLLETLRHLRDRGDVTIDERGVWHTRVDATTDDYSELALPSSVLDTVRARVKALGEDARRVLDVLAVLGRPAPLALLESVARLDPWRVADIVASAAASGFVRVERSSVRLAHDLHRVALLSGLDAPRRAVLHRELARALAVSGPSATEVAHHFVLAEEFAQGAEWLLRAAREAMAAYAWKEAGDFADRALTLAPNGASRARALSLIVELRHLTGDLGGTSAHLDELRRLADELQDEALQLDADVHLARFKYDTGDHAGVVGITERLVDGARPDGVRAKGHLWRGLSLVRLGRMDDAREHLTAALRLEPSRRTRWTFNVHWALTQIHLAGGRFDEAHAHGLEALETARVLGDPLVRAQAAMLAGAVFLARGEPEEATSFLTEAADVARTLDQPKLKASIALNLGAANTLARRYEAAAHAFDLALRETASLPDLDEVARANLGATRFMLGDVDAALTLLEDALTRARARGASLDVTRRLLSLANVHLSCGNADVSARLNEARALVEELDLKLLRHFLASLDLARALLEGAREDVAAGAACLAALEADVQGDEVERHHLLLAEAHLALGNADEARRRVERAPTGAWRARLELATFEAPDVPTARTWLDDDTVPALDAARLASAIARFTNAPEDWRVARRRSATLLRHAGPLRRDLEARLARRGDRQTVGTSE